MSDRFCRRGHALIPGNMTSSTEQGGPIRGWALDLAPHGVREPVVFAGSFATLEEAMAEAARRDGQQLTWRPPDPSYLGWMAAGQEGWWLIQATATTPIFSSKAERSKVARKGARRGREIRTVGGRPPAGAPEPITPRKNGQRNG